MAPEQDRGDDGRDAQGRPRDQVDIPTPLTQADISTLHPRLGIATKETKEYHWTVLIGRDLRPVILSGSSPPLNSLKCNICRRQRQMLPSTSM